MGDESEERFCQLEALPTCDDVDINPCHERATCEALPSGKGVKCTCLSPWVGDGKNTDTGCMLPETMPFTHTGNYCPMPWNNQEYTPTGRLLDITWEGLHMSKECQSGLEGSFCKFSCDGNVNTAGLEQLACRCVKKTKSNECFWQPTDKIAIKMNLAEIQCRDRRPACEADLMKITSKYIGKTLKPIRTVVLSQLNKEGVILPKSEKLTYDYKVKGSNISADNKRFGGQALDPSKLVAPSEWSDYYGSEHKSDTTFTLSVGMDDGEYLDIIDASCYCVVSKSKSKCSYLYNLHDQPKKSKKWPKLSHVMKFTDLVKWSYSKMELRRKN